MLIEFMEGSLLQHPNMERYFKASGAHGATPFRFDAAARADEAPATLAVHAFDEFERKAKELQADLLEATLVATWIGDPARPGWRLYRAIVIAQERRPEPARVVERVDADL